ncbi:hypothetical protein PHK61_04285 [Actinomycetospora lutea]|uniref:hypothetical protein n=1 Tax=Actinomycetospora lutea TaxID=663604 RepID=UPI002366F840|nr:hypothetical protein [Actinomycetospora lutea]MDD7937638.1 hypothetical protein [Actinomycetospora lutea]
MSTTWPERPGTRTGDHPVLAPATGRYVRVPDETVRPDRPFVPSAVPTRRPSPSPRTAPGGPAHHRDRPSPAPGVRPAVTGGHPTTAPAPRRRWSLVVWAAGGLVVGLLGVLGMVVVVGWPPGTSPLPAPVSAAPVSPAPVSAAADGATPAVPSAPTGTLAAAFPDVTALGDRCAPYPIGADQYVTSSGARPVAVVLCDYGAAVPGGFVYYAEWSAAADARRWHDDQRIGGPSLDGITVWGHGADQRQGPLHRRTAPDGTVYATAAYADRPYTFDIVTRSLDDSNRMFPAMHLLPGAQLPLGR